MTVGKFRAAILGSWLLGLLGAVLAIILVGTLPEELRLHMERTLDPDVPLDGRARAFLWVAVPYTLLSLWNAVELWRLRPRARGVYTGLVVGCLVITPLGGPYVDVGFATAAFYGASLLAGAVLVAAWWVPSIAEHFGGMRPTRE